MIPYTKNRNVLYIDDEEELLRSFRSLMRKENCKVITLADSTRIEEVLKKEGPFSVVLSDQRMPGFDGVKVLELCRSIYPDAIRILVTGYADQKDTIRAVNIGGINSYIAKPWIDEEIKFKIGEWIDQYNLKAENRFLLKELDKENEKLNELLEGTVAQTVKVLGDIAGHAAPQIASFGERVKVAGNVILQNIEAISTEERWEIMRAFDLFNLGIVLLPVPVQLSVNRDGLAALKQSVVASNHHLLAAGLLKNIPRFGPVARMVELQKKNFDGSGEPKDDKINGKEIPLGARLLRILIDMIKPGDTISNLKQLLQQLEKNPRKYDTELIAAISAKISDKPLISGEEFLPIAELKPGMLLLKDVVTINNRHLLLKGGCILTNTFINILKQWHAREPIEEPIRIRNV